MNPDENQPQAEQPDTTAATSADVNDSAPAADSMPAADSAPVESAPAAEPAPQAAPATVEPVVAPAPQAKSKKTLVIAGLVLVVVGVAVGAVVYFMSLK